MFILPENGNFLFHALLIFYQFLPLLFEESQNILSFLPLANVRNKVTLNTGDYLMCNLDYTPLTAIFFLYMEKEATLLNYPISTILLIMPEVDPGLRSYLTQYTMCN